MNARFHIIIAATLTATGVVAGLTLSGHWSRNLSAKPTEAQSPRDYSSAQNVSGDPVKTNDKRDLASLIERKKEKSELVGPLESALERLGSASLKELVLEQSAALVTMESNGEDAQVARKILDASVHELWKREGVAALDWAVDLEGATDQKSLLDALLGKALSDNPVAVFPWMEANRAEIRTAFTSFSLTSIAMTAVVEHGVDHIVEAQKIFSASRNIYSFESATFPPDFDFASLYKALYGKIDLSPVLKEWVLRDEDAAWEVAEENFEEHPSDQYLESPIGSMITAKIAVVGEREGIRWALKKLAGVDPKIRDSQLMSKMGDIELSAEGISMIAETLEPDARIYYAWQTLKQNGWSEKSFAVLDSVPRRGVLDILEREFYMPEDDPVKAGLISRYQITEEEISSIKEKIDLEDPFR